MTNLKAALRSILESRGYFLSHYDVLPWGLDILHDIKRLSQEWRLPVRTFFDVGANVGQTSVPALATFPQARVVAFEPSEQSYKKLIAAIGSEPRFSAFKLALSTAPGKAAFFEHEDSSLNSLLPDAAKGWGHKDFHTRTEVECDTLDNFCQANGINSIDVLKIDVEGCEMDVLSGAKQMLAGNVRFVTFEFMDTMQRGKSTGFVPITQFLDPFGFRLVATYTQTVSTHDPRGLFTVANALFVLPRTIRP